MTQPTLSPQDLSRLADLARILVPGSERMPSVDEIKGFEDLLRRAVKASAVTEAELRPLLTALPQRLDWGTVKVFASTDRAGFETLAQLVSGAYLMAPEVLERLGFPTERRFPAGPEEFADEYETGILDPVVGRGPRFRDPRGPARS
ncbi:MAG: hypothetical protein R3D57_07490 [Hyphomicrobiaceae bacterium]